MLFLRRTAFISLFYLCAASLAQAVPPGEDWLSLKTTHFILHHTAPETKLAEAFANALERAYAQLTKDLAWEPVTPIDIVINDESDSANGSARSVPFNLLEIYAVPFPTESSLVDYDNWVEELATHELTHIIANDTGFDAYKTLRSIFGSVVKPNGMQPVWLIEGLAVFEETNNTSGGRGRSLLTEALLRTAASHKKLGADDYITLDRFNNGVFWWPAGNTPYLLGYTIQAAAEGERKDNRVVSTPEYGSAEQTIPGMVSTNNGQRIPYQLQSNLSDILSEDWTSVWHKSIAKLTERYPATPPDESNPAFCQLTRGGRFTGGQAISPDGWIYFTLEHVDEGSALARVPIDGDCDNPDVEILAERKRGGPAQVSVSPDGRHVAYSELYTADSFHQFYELRLYDVKKKTITPLTQAGTRAFDPSFTADGSAIVYVRNLGNGRQAIARVDVDKNGKAEDLFTAEDFERLSHPFVSGQSIYFSRHNNQGQEEILRMPVTGGAAVPAINPKQFNKGSRFIEQDPFVDDKGTLYYSAYYPSPKDTRSMDIYTLSVGSNTPVLQVQSGSGFLSKPVSTENGRTLVAANYYLNGFDLVRINLDKRGDLFAGLPEQKVALHESLIETEKKSPEPFPPSAPTEKKADIPYSVLSTPASSLWPHYWLPNYEIVPDGFFIGASTSGEDPLEQHQYDLSLQYDSRANFPTYSASYTNWVYPIGLSLFARQHNSYFQGSQTSNRISLYALEATLPHDPWFLNMGFAYQQRNYFNVLNKSPFIFANARFADIRQTPSAIAPNRGLGLNSYLAFYPATSFDHEFIDWRPELDVFSTGLNHSHSISGVLHAGITTNKYLASNYYLGGGIAALGDTNDFVVRGYPSDVLLGQHMASANLAYTLPLSRPYSGWGTNPYFFRELGARFLFDAGTANYTARYDGKTFLGYDHDLLGSQVLTGLGGELLFNNTLLYYIPLDIAVGIHQGLLKRNGGETTFYLGMNVDIPGITHNCRSSGPNNPQ